MRAWLVRGKEDKYLIGIFVAENMWRLCDLVDDYTSPDNCECCSLKDGGIYFPQDFKNYLDTRPEEYTNLVKPNPDGSPTNPDGHDGNLIVDINECWSYELRYPDRQIWRPCKSHEAADWRL